MSSRTATTTSSSSSGIGFTGMLAILFIALKLIGVISWPWVWVLAPIWISCLLAVLVIGIVVAVIFFKR